MKRTLSLLLVLTMILCLLSACGGSEPAASVSSAQETVSAESDSAPEAAEPAEEAPEAAESAREDDETTPEEAPEEAEAEPAPAGDSLPNYVELPITAEPITLTLWTTVNPMLADTINSLDQCALWDVLEERTNIHMDGKLISAMAGQEQFQLMMASGDYTDLLDSPGSNYSTGLQGALDDDVLVDLTDVVADCMPNYSAIVATNDEYIQGTKVDDGRIGMIYNLKPETYMPTEGPVIRQDYLDDLGLPSPVTYDDLHDVLVAFRDNYGATMWIPFSGSPLGNYLGAGYGVASTYLTFMSGREPFYQVDGEVKFGPMEDGFFDYLTMLNQWYEEGLIWSDFASYTERFNMPPEDGILSGQFGVFFCGTANWQMWANASEDPDFRLVAFHDPVLKAGDTNHLRAENFLVTQGGVGISTTCAYPEEAAKLIDYCFSEEGRFLLSFGTEGKTFEYDDQGHPQYTDLITANPDGLNQTAAMAIYVSFGISSIEHPDTAYLVTTNTPDQDAAAGIWTETSDNAYGIPNVISMTVDESAENASLLSDVGTYVSTWMVKAIMGDQPLTPEAIQEFRDTMEGQLQIGTCIANKQAALDRYMSR